MPPGDTGGYPGITPENSAQNHPATPGSNKAAREGLKDGHGPTGNVPKTPQPTGGDGSAPR
ncbi:hypothetical protein GCM10023144_03660 [Pigmentiphaga soli]|uniref:Uncharacterized protein n=1 Tax=Pigmentiphaga soli TaxID=1007095 RepID=A0ABP8GFL9_9BURK